MKTRKAISPVLATVILIAITLIAAIAIAGFIFGLFNGFENPAEVTATSSLSSFQGPQGTITHYNNGLSSANLQGVVLTYSGQSCKASYYSSNNVVPSSGSLEVTIQQGQFPSTQCGQSGSPSGYPSPGMQYSGYAVINGGSQIPFTGTFS